jgi:hypothetical protein
MTKVTTKTKKIPKKIIGTINPTVVDTINGRYLIVVNSTNNTNGWHRVADTFTFEDAQKLFVRKITHEVSSKEWSWQIKNSKGTGFYTVTFDKGGWSCDCTGYGFRRKCRHIDEAKTKLN